MRTRRVMRTPTNLAGTPQARGVKTVHPSQIRQVTGQRAQIAGGRDQLVPPAEFGGLEGNAREGGVLFEERLDGCGAFLGFERAPNDWSNYNGLVIWDLEYFPLDWDGSKAGSVTPRWGPQGTVYDPTNEMVEWEYDAAVRYFWERVHQWFVHVKASQVEAFVMYQHPQRPTASQGLDNEWDGGEVDASAHRR